MSGILAALPGVLSRPIVYTPGWFGPAGPDPSPISRSLTNVPGPFTETWVGYFQPNVTGTVTLGVWATVDNVDFFQQYSQGSFWFGQTAITGFNSGNRLIFADNDYVTAPVSVTAGVYYPIRLQWDANLRQGVNRFTQGQISFWLNNQSNVSGQIFYNSLTNGF
jgi:hypothetical protein